MIAHNCFVEKESLPISFKKCKVFVYFKIEDIEQKIKSYEDRLDSIDRSLRLGELSLDERYL